MNNLTYRSMDRRANTLLRTVRNVPPNSEIIRELAEITIALEDAPVKPVVIARLTVRRTNHRRTIVEIHEGATFQSFFHVYSQEGNRRSTKRHTRVGNRNEGIYHGALGLEGMAERLAHYQIFSGPIESSKLRIIKKRAYRHLLNVSPDQIGIGRGS